MDPVTDATLVAAGLYDPAAPAATDRRALLDFLVEQGATVEEMLAADAQGRLFGLAGDRVVRPGGDTLSLDQLAERLGAPAPVVRRLWNALGLTDPGPGALAASDADLAALPVFFTLRELLGEDEALGLARVVGAAMARIADAGSAAIRRVADLNLDTTRSEAVTARAYLEVARLVPQVSALADAAFRHHITVARRHFEQSASIDVAGERLMRVGVGFADLCGFTSLAQTLTMPALSRLLAGFEETAADVVHAGGGRVVKFIGDAVMYVAPRPGPAAAIALDLVSAAAAAGLEGRAGVTYGAVLAQEGDYFGPLVNLAARLVALADPGAVLAPAEMGELVGGEGLHPEPAGVREVRGFDGAVPVVRFLRTPVMQDGAGPC